MSMLPTQTVLRLCQIFLDMREADHRWDDSQKTQRIADLTMLRDLIPEPDSRFAHFSRQFYASVEAMRPQEIAELLALYYCGRGTGGSYEQCLKSESLDGYEKVERREAIAGYLIQKKLLPEHLIVGLQQCTDPQLAVGDPWIDPRMVAKEIQTLKEYFERRKREKENEAQGSAD